jgi:light-regulated signal transduction histidine kinase (bacteriophytochrome)
MQQLINDLLAYSRVGNRPYKLKLTDCGAVLKTVVRNLAMAIEEKRTVITQEVLPSIRADGPRLEQLFQNLIGNAIKFHGGDSPRVHVAVEKKGNEWVFSVTDNGIGIAPGDSQRIFDIFQRLHRKEEYPGTGMGLAICKKIVERHGGRIWVESQCGKGSSFCFTIPEDGGITGARTDASG